MTIHHDVCMVTMPLGLQIHQVCPSLRLPSARTARWTPAAPANTSGAGTAEEGRCGFGPCPEENRWKLSRWTEKKKIGLTFTKMVMTRNLEVIEIQSLKYGIWQISHTSGMGTAPGPTSCIDGKCQCREGYCQKAGLITPKHLGVLLGSQYCEGISPTWSMWRCFATLWDPGYSEVKRMLQGPAGYEDYTSKLQPETRSSLVSLLQVLPEREVRAQAAEMNFWTRIEPCTSLNGAETAPAPKCQVVQLLWRRGSRQVVTTPAWLWELVSTNLKTFIVGHAFCCAAWKKLLQFQAEVMVVESCWCKNCDAQWPASH